MHVHRSSLVQYMRARCKNVFSMNEVQNEVFHVCVSFQDCLYFCKVGTTKHIATQAKGL